MEGSGTNSYYISGYFGSYSYYFQFSDYHINTNYFNDTLGHLIVQIVDIPWGTRLPPEGIKDWTLIQREDALIEERRSVVISLMGAGVDRPLGPATKGSSGTAERSTSTTGRARHTARVVSRRSTIHTRRIFNK
jgi:hypothetical protein